MGTQADIVENFASGDGPELLLSENALIDRTADGVTLNMKLIAPEPGSYTYPEEVPVERQGAPETFTGGAFVFYPEFCATQP
jgi:hypothetical protein